MAFRAVSTIQSPQISIPFNSTLSIPELGCTGAATAAGSKGCPAPRCCAPSPVLPAPSLRNSVSHSRGPHHLRTLQCPNPHPAQRLPGHGVAAQGAPAGWGGSGGTLALHGGGTADGAISIPAEGHRPQPRLRPRMGNAAPSEGSQVPAEFSGLPRKILAALKTSSMRYCVFSPVVL